MASEYQSGTDGANGPRLTSLMPPDRECSAPELVESYSLWQRPERVPERPRVMLNMVSTLDGRATLDGRSGSISGPADRALFHALRAPVDAVLVGAGTVRTERYGRLIPDEQVRRLRSERGLPEEPIACIVSGRLALDEEVPLLQTEGARVAIITTSTASLPATTAEVDYIRSEGRQLDLPAALAELSARFGVASLLCEGGPHIARQLLGANLLDEVFLSLSPLLAGGEPSGGEALRILTGLELEDPAKLELLGVATADSSLFLRYRVVSAR